MVKRGEIYYIDLEDKNLRGCEQGGERPCLIIQNDIGNKYSPTVIVAVITSIMSKTDLPTHVEIEKRGQLYKNSVVLTEQIRTVDKSRLKNKIGYLNESEMEKVDGAIRISLGI